MEGNGNLDEYSNEHPMVRIHPETKKKILYVNSMYTKKIVGMDKKESDEILKQIFEHGTFSDLYSLSLIELLDLRKNYELLNYSTTEINLHLLKLFSYPFYLFFQFI